MWSPTRGLGAPAETAAGTPLENYARYVDSRAEQINLDSITAFQQSGGALFLFGTYDQWPRNDNADASSFPLLQSIVAADNMLPAPPTNALANFGSLTLSNATLTMGLATAQRRQYAGRRRMAELEHPRHTGRHLLVRAHDGGRGFVASQPR